MEINKRMLVEQFIKQSKERYNCIYATEELKEVEKGEKQKNE